MATKKQEAILGLHGFIKVHGFDYIQSLSSVHMFEHPNFIVNKTYRVKPRFYINDSDNQVRCYYPDYMTLRDLLNKYKD